MAVTGGEASQGWRLPWLQTTVARTWKVVLANNDLALQSPAYGADPSPATCKVARLQSLEHCWATKEGGINIPVECAR
jgi:hypothetical protein